MSNIGNKEVFSKNLRFYMNQRGKSRRDICIDLGFVYTTFCDWINGHKYPRIDKIEMLANYFHVKKSDLIESKDKLLVISDSDFQNLKGKKIPVLGYVRAGIPISAVEDIIDYEEISEDMSRQGEFFGLKVKGDSMEPKISDGDVVIVRQQTTVENGDTAVVLINGDDATIKKFYRTDTGIKLISTNPAYDPFYFSPSEVDSLRVQIIGKVVELRAKF